MQNPEKPLVMQEPFRPLLITVNEACMMLRISRTRFYKYVREGKVVLKRLGANQSRVVYGTVERLAEGLPNSEPGTPIKRDEDREKQKQPKVTTLEDLGL